MQPDAVQRQNKPRVCRFILIGALCLTTASASEIFPETQTLRITDAEDKTREVILTRNGTGRCSWGFLFIKLYEAALYLEQTSRDPNSIIQSRQVKRIEQRFLRALSKKQMVKAFQSSIKINAGDNLPTYQEELNQLCTLIPSVAKGDKLVYTAIPGVGLDIQLGQQRLGSIPGDRFARLFIKLFVGPKPPTTALRQGLLGR